MRPLMVLLVVLVSLMIDTMGRCECTEYKTRTKTKKCSKPKEPVESKECAPFNVGMAWSHTGPIAGKTCVLFEEPWDKNGWDDNYLCFNKDYGIKWSYAGPIADMKCAKVNEPLDPDGWWDNYLCVPKASTFEFENAPFGVIANRCCVKTDEPLDPHYWTDNYICLKESVPV